MYLSFSFFWLGLGVALGAFGAHGLQPHLSEHAMTTFHTAVTYHFYAGIWLSIMSLVRYLKPDAMFGIWPLRLCVWGTVCFSGSLYLYLLLHMRMLVFITPIGGLLLLASLLSEAWAHYTHKRP